VNAPAAWLLAAVLAGGPLAAQEADSAARPPLVGYEASVRLRPRFTTSSADDDEPARWELDRLRLQGRLSVRERVQARVQLDFGGGEWSVDDAWLRMRLARGADVLVGQAKRPFTVLSMRSGSQVATVSRGASLRGARAAEEQNLVNDFGFGDRAMGIQLSVGVPIRALPLRVQAGVFPAEPWDAPLRTRGMQLGARAEARVAPEVTAGVAWSTRGGRDADDDDPLPSGRAVGIDVEVGDDVPGPHLLAEVVAGSVEGDGGFRGAHLWMMYRTHPLGAAGVTLEPVVRWSVAEGAVPEGSRAGMLVTPGVNVYLGDPRRWNRVMIDYDLWNRGGAGGRARSLKLQMQVGVG
jgi:hypothetical protein